MVRVVEFGEEGLEPFNLRGAEQEDMLRVLIWLVSDAGKAASVGKSLSELLNLARYHEKHDHNDDDDRNFAVDGLRVDVSEPNSWNGYDHEVEVFVDVEFLLHDNEEAWVDDNNWKNREEWLVYQSGDFCG